MLRILTTAFALLVLLSPQASNAMVIRRAAHWQEIYNGYGYNAFSNGAWTLAPTSPMSQYDTHASLVVSGRELTGNYSLSVKMTPQQQLRATPNPWETGWITFGYKPDGTFKYLILKPDGYGVELGESLGNDVQNFLYTSPVGAQSFPIGQTYDVTLTVKYGRIIAKVNGVTVMNYVMSARDRLTANGRFGWYTEDAKVVFGAPNVRQY